MNKKKIILTICALALVILVFQTGKIVGAATSEPGSVGDPLITKSYLEQQLNTIQSSFIKINVNKGNTITFSDGSEFVIYKGNAVITGNSGMINLSTGEIFKKDMTPVMYNTFLSVDGSGLRATGNLVIYVRGSYTIS